MRGAQKALTTRNDDQMTSIEIATKPPRFAEMPFCEQLIIWAVRFWVQNFKNQCSVDEPIQHGFALARIPEAHRALDDFLTIVAYSSEAGIDIRCPNHPGTSIDEQRILGVIAALQVQGAEKDAESFLSIWLPPAAIRCALTAATTLAKSVGTEGLSVRARDSGPFASILPNPLPARPSHQKGSTTVH